jgi:hypothetical protein
MPARSLQRHTSTSGSGAGVQPVMWKKMLYNLTLVRKAVTQSLENRSAAAAAAAVVAGRSVVQALC